MITLTPEIWAEMKVSHPSVAKAMLKDPTYQPVILKFDELTLQSDIAFSNQSEFDIKGVGVFTFDILAMLVLTDSKFIRNESKAGSNMEDGKAWTVTATPSAYTKKQAIKATWDRIQKGLVAQGKQFATYEDYRNRINELAN
jgi:hypothetical protein